jgi:hypothetical protein
VRDAFVARRHCEERTDEAIQSPCSALDCVASLAMTEQNKKARGQPALFINPKAEMITR